MSAQRKAFSPRILVQLLFVVVVMPFLPMIISGDWRWLEAWIYAVFSLLGFVLSRALAAQRHPDILEERARSMGMQDAKAWDKILAPAVALGSLAILFVAGLDHLFGWTDPFTRGTKVAAFVVFLLGYGLGAWALIENRFFSGVVRIQKDRDHQVVSTGPYRFIRHPGYAGALLAFLATPLFLDSARAFLPAFLLAGVLVLRTALEDSTLQQELPGYLEFTQRTRYRLFPGLW